MKEPASLLTPDHVATLFSISKRAVYVLISSGKLRAIRIGGLLRVDPNEIERFKQANIVQPSAKVSTTVTSPPTRTRVDPWRDLPGADLFVS
jgi:excisionase family DNA binding protein